MKEFFDSQLPEAIKAFLERMDSEQQDRCVKLSHALSEAAAGSNPGIAIAASLLLAYCLREEFHKALAASKVTLTPDAAKHVM